MTRLVNDVGLVLEGGGMRGIYTAGVLDCLSDWGLKFPLVASSSSSALIGSYYISEQRGQIFEAYNYLTDNHRIISFKHMMTHKELFRMDLLFQLVPEKVAPFDYRTFTESGVRFLISTTDILTGSAVYHDTFPSQEILFTLARASSSLPVFAPSVAFEDKLLVDGGVADPIPIKPSIERGYRRNVVILTRNRGYIKKPSSLGWAYRRLFRQYPELIKLLKNRHERYNQTTQDIQKMDRDRDVFLICPEKPLIAGRMERNKLVLQELYMQGYTEMQQKKEALHSFLLG
ncbi:patatin-like phospholipase family protein [Paenibacillus apis]|uniref:Patatin family protein n=1 Tax=Paenibacillus apis TaxID=1792174 RepID=A0A919XW19_9BACL|nr:patatin family protein [Paenibacillus apis]GIO40326.1 patatin family protein [Paenibacillus apis]